MWETRLWVLCVGGEKLIWQVANEALITFSMGTIAKWKPMELLDVQGEHSVEDGKWPCLYKLLHLKLVKWCVQLWSPFQKSHLNNGESSKENCKHNPGQERKTFIAKPKRLNFFQERLRNNIIPWKQLLVHHLNGSTWNCHPHLFEKAGKCCSMLCMWLSSRLK